MQNNQISIHEQPNKKLNQLEHDELLKQAIHFQNLSKQYHKELTKCEKKNRKACRKKKQEIHMNQSQMSLNMKYHNL